jgi:hypothetical protein
MIHSSVVEHLGCLRNLATVNSAAINMGVTLVLDKIEIDIFFVSIGA